MCTQQIQNWSYKINSNFFISAISYWHLHTQPEYMLAQFYLVSAVINIIVLLDMQNVQSLNQHILSAGFEFSLVILCMPSSPFMSP